MAPFPLIIYNRLFYVFLFPPVQDLLRYLFIYLFMFHIRKISVAGYSQLDLS